MLLLILLLIAAASRTDILPIAGVQTTQTLRPYVSTATVGFRRMRLLLPPHLARPRQLTRFSNPTMIPLTPSAVSAIHLPPHLVPAG